MLNGPANERLLTALDVELVEYIDQDLEQAARDWLARVPARAPGVRHDSIPAVEAVERALKRLDERRGVG